MLARSSIQNIVFGVAVLYRGPRDRPRHIHKCPRATVKESPIAVQQGPLRFQRTHERLHDGNDADNRTGTFGQRRDWHDRVDSCGNSRRSRHARLRGCDLGTNPSEAVIEATVLRPIPRLVFS